MGTMHRVRNPWTGERDYEFAEPTQSALDAESERLHAAQHRWFTQGLDFRIEQLRRFKQSLGKYREPIIRCLEQDTGRVRIAALEFDMLVDAIDRNCEAALQVIPESTPGATSVEQISARKQKVPYGLMLNIAPWNFPLILSFLDVIPALVAGNAALIKPSEVTPRWTDPVRKAIAEVDELASILGILVGTGQTGARLIEQADVLSFTGSVKTGRIVATAAAQAFIPAFFELGGKDPAIVLKSADLDAAVSTILYSSISSSGQACQSLERVYVDREIMPTFVDRIVEQARQTSINYPDKQEGIIGPFIFDKQPDTVKAHLDDALAKGATLRCGGEFIAHGGVWLEATVLTGVNHSMLVMSDETFGPVIPIMGFSSVDQAIELANDTKYGLSASVFAGSMDEGVNVARRVNAGAVSVNDASLTARIHDTPHDSFGFSGLGRSRFGLDGIARYTREKAIFQNESAIPALVR
jgi:succinate-semialdehyde dehydrogenase/glutarate-semialdehyde dehydrogenase